MRVSVLDQSTVVGGHTPGDAIRDTLALAETCEQLGYHRFWVSEHHNNAGIAGSAPEILLGALAARTSRIRIGSAGIMLPHYAPLKVAEQFRVLEALAPGRVDLGIGRGPGANQQACYALRPWSFDNPLALASMDTFAEDVGDLIAWSGGKALPEDHPFAGVVAQPAGVTSPEHWVVGSSPYTAHLAAHYGLPYCFAHFFRDGEGAKEALNVYRAEFRPGQIGSPHTAVCAWAVSASSSAEAEQLFADYALWRLRRDRGADAPISRALQPFGGADREIVAKLRARTFVGTAGQVVHDLAALRTQLNVDELIIVTATSDPDNRVRSYQDLASAFHLIPPRDNIHSSRSTANDLVAHS